MSPDPRTENAPAPDYAHLQAALSSGQHPVTKLKDGSGVMLHLSGMQVLALNETAMFLVEKVRGGLPRASLADSLARAFDVSREAAEADVERFLASLVEAFQTRRG